MPVPVMPAWCSGARRKPCGWDSGGILAAVAALALLLGCASPLPRGDGPVTITVQPAEIETPTGRLVGGARFELIDYEDDCPRLFGRTMISRHKTVAIVGANANADETVQIVLTPGHRYKLSLDHLGAGDGADRTCGAELWFTASDRADYVIRLQSDLVSCKLIQSGRGASRLEAHPTCEAAAEAAAEIEAPGESGR